METLTERADDSSSDNTIEGLGLTVSEMRGVARRQFVGSIIAGILIVAVAVVIGFRSTPNAPSPYTAAHNGVQQPVFVTPSDHVIATAKRKIEAP